MAGLGARRHAAPRAVAILLVMFLAGLWVSRHAKGAFHRQWLFRRPGCGAHLPPVLIAVQPPYPFLEVVNGLLKILAAALGGGLDGHRKRRGIRKRGRGARRHFGQGGDRRRTGARCGCAPSSPAISASASRASTSLPTPPLRRIIGAFFPSGDAPRRRPARLRGLRRAGLCRPACRRPVLGGLC